MFIALQAHGELRTRTKLSLKFCINTVNNLSSVLVPIWVFSVGPIYGKKISAYNGAAAANPRDTDKRNAAEASGATTI